MQKKTHLCACAAWYYHGPCPKTWYDQGSCPQKHYSTINKQIKWYFLLHQYRSDTMSITPAVWQSAWIKENETLTECLACGNIISACFCALFCLCRWYEKALDWWSLCSVSIRSKLISLKVERSLVWSPEQISWLWSPVFLDFCSALQNLHQLQTALPLE